MKRRILITCGPASEPIDEVRSITNFSTGTLGITMANDFSKRGWEVICIVGKKSSCTIPLVTPYVYFFETNTDLIQHLETLSHQQQPEAILHAAALADYRLESITDEQGKPLHAAKVESSHPEIHLKLVPAPKVLPQLRDLFPRSYLVGWKYELNGSRNDAMAKAFAQIRACRTNLCVLNGRAAGDGFTLCEPDGRHTCAPDAAALGELLSRMIPVEQVLG